jgi:N-acetylglucosamine transport system permease protein
VTLTAPAPGREIAHPVETAPRRSGEHGLSIFTHFFLIGWSIITGLPILWVLMSSVKSDNEIFVDSWKPPAMLRFDNYARAWTDANFSQYFFNSFLIVACAVVIVMVLGSMMSYGLARYDFPGKTVLNYAFIGAMAVPIFLAVVPLFGVMKQLGVLNTYHGMIAVYVAYAMPFTVFFLSGFFATLPKEISEASFIDGAGHFRTFFYVMVPMARPGIISIGIFNALGMWNQYLLPLFLNNEDPNKYVVTQGLAKMAADAGYASDFSGLFAGLIIGMAPVLILYLLFQKQIQSGMTAGALK